MERARWWQVRLGFEEGEFKAVVSEFPQLLTTGGVGYSEDGCTNIVIFVGGKCFKDFLDLSDLIDTWLHEFVEVEFCEEVDDHEAFSATITRVARYVSSL